MTTEDDAVVAHYANGNLMARILAALEQAGQDTETLSVETLSTLDHLHGGAAASTETQVALAGIARGSHVLDAGCGIGGPSRYLAHRLDCTVEAIDLTPEFVATAQALNDRVGLADRIGTRVGSVTDLPFDDAVFDAVLCQNVTMNVADKPTMFAEAFRVLKPGGLYTISHLAHGPKGDPIYPLPWARTAEVSFPDTPDSVVAMLEAAGFTDIRNRASDAAVAPPDQSQTNIGSGPAMGDDMPQRIGNSQTSISEGRLVPMLLIMRRPQVP